MPPPSQQSRPDREDAQPMVVDATNSQPPPLYACPHCQTRFLTATGLDKHVATHGHEVQADGQTIRAAKIPRVDTVQIMLSKPSQQIGAASKTFQCPLCQDTVGRKALIDHLTREHKVDRPPFFVFRPSRDMTPGRLACAHCHTTYTTEAALRLHYQRANCPTLLIEWVRDQHYGPIIPSSAPLEAPETADRTSEGQTSTSASGRTVRTFTELCMPADTPEYTIEMIRPLLTPSFMHADAALLRPVPFWPELRLNWYQVFATWMANLSALPHEVTLHLRLLDFCQQVFPCHWAWDSVEQALLQYTAIDFHSTAWIQHFHFQQLLFELEHVLAQDWFLRCLALDLTDGTYERRRSIFCRTDGSLWQSLCKEAQNRGGGGTAIRPTACTQGAAEALALIGFGLGRRWKLDLHASQTDPTTGGSTQPASPRQELHLLRAGRKKQYSAADVEAVEGLAWAEGIRSGHDILEATHVQSSVRGIGLSSFETTLRIKRSRIDSSPSEQADIDGNQFMELPSLEFQGENSEACSPRSPSTGGSRSFDPEDSYSDSSGRLDPQVLGPETHASGFDSHGLSGGAMAPSSSGPVRVPTEIDRQRAYAADLRSNPTVDTAKVTIGSGHCSSLDEMRQAILALSLGNVSNACYMDSALLAELWACCMDDTFAWHEVGHWKDPLIRLLANSNTHQMLQDEHCLGQLLQSWHTSHEMGKQQDSAEFVGWLRYAMHGASTDSGKSVSKWEARLEATTEDSGSLFAPVLVQQTKDGDCTLQNLVNLWHEQVPFQPRLFACK